jgi:uncharacterized protein (TIGR00369 family)
MELPGMTAISKPAEYGLIPREIAIQMSGLELLQAVISGAQPGPPIAQTADFRITEVENGRIVFEGMPSMKFYNPLGTVHGGWISAILDSAMGCAVHSTLAAGQTYTTINMTINFVRPVFETTGKVRCEGIAVHGGSRLATSEARLWDEAGKLLAHGSEACLIMTPPKLQG